jgi:hypothetical protein
MLVLVALSLPGCRASTADDWEDDGGRADDGDGRVDGEDGAAEADADADTDGDGDARTDAEAEAEADAEVPCPCPVLPTTCTPTAGDTPVFAPPNDETLDQLFALLACATTSIRVAIYETDWDCLVDALLAKLAAAPGITLEMVIDDDRCPVGTDGLLTCPLSRLAGRTGVTIVPDNRSGLMHHKFALFDDTRLWVSSANFTRWSFCTDYNNSIVVDQAEIVARFGAVFRRLFVDGVFGPVAPEAPVTGGAYTVYFSPESPATLPARWFNDLVTEVGTATTTIDVLINAWTREEVSTALIAAHGRGVTVRAVVEDMYLADAPAQALITAGIPVRAESVHDKVMIIDGRLVLTGSANWSANAWSNNENSLWIDDDAVGAAYRAEFERVYATARIPP